MSYAVTVIVLKNKTKLLVKIDTDNYLILEDIRKKIKKAFEGEWVMIPESVKFEVIP